MLEIITDIDFSIPSIICGDPVRIQQIILNLLKNAVKFTNHGYIHLELKKTGQNILFTIKDTGIGIPKDDLDKVFESLQIITRATFPLTADSEEQDLDFQSAKILCI